MNGGDTAWRLLESEAFGKLAQFVMKTSASAAIGTTSADKACQAALAVTADPSLGRAQRHRGVVGDLRQRHILFEIARSVR
jgi:hypothetical protein